MIAIEQVVRLKYPSADLSQYFYFLRQASGKDHKHHIAPRAEFPELVAVKENSITLSFQEHFYAHYLLALAVPECRAFQIAFYMMANFHNTHIDTSEVPQLAELFERGMRMQKQYMSALGQRNVKSGHLASVSARARTHKHQVKAGEQGGKASQMTHKQNRTGCYSFAHQSETAIVGNHKRYHTDRGLISDKCELCQA